MRKLLFAAAAAILASPPASAIPPLPPPPRLLVVITIDQLSADLFDAYRPHFTGAFSRLAGGTVFRNGYQAHAATVTCPGHAAVATGTHPARNGIVGNSWIDQSGARAARTVDCIEDERGSAPSAANLRVPTLADLMKRRWPAGRNIAVAGKHRSALMMAGQSADQIAYWNGSGFIGGSGGIASATLTAANGAIRRAVSTSRPALASPPLCAAKAQPVAVAGRAPVGTGAFARAAGDANAFIRSPEFDASVLALSAALVRDLRLGQGGGPDILSIGLSATDYVGHHFGTGGQEMCLQLLSLDRDLGDFLAFMDRANIDYAIALSADHGGDDLPERLRLKGIAEAQRVDPGLAASAVGRAIAGTLGLDGPVLLGGATGDMHIDARLPTADRARVRAEALRRYRAHPQVSAVFTREEIAATALSGAPPDKWSLLERVRASFDAQRSGDFTVILKPHVTPIGHVTGSVATHGSPWDYDRRVPIMFWRRGFTGSPSEQAVATVDIMPTLAAWVGLDLASGSTDGQCLAGVASVICPSR